MRASPRERSLTSPAPPHFAGGNYVPQWTAAVLGGNDARLIKQLKGFSVNNPVFSLPPTADGDDDDGSGNAASSSSSHAAAANNNNNNNNNDEAEPIAAGSKSWVAAARVWAPTAIQWGANMAEVYRGTVSGGALALD